MFSYRTDSVILKLGKKLMTDEWGSNILVTPCCRIETRELQYLGKYSLWSRTNRSMNTTGEGKGKHILVYRLMLSDIYIFSKFK